MRIKKLLFAAATLLSGYNFVQNSNEVTLSDQALANVEALASGEWPTTLGGKRSDGSTCYVFDGNGNLIDKRKNQYPG